MIDPKIIYDTLTNFAVANMRVIIDIPAFVIVLLTIIMVFIVTILGTAAQQDNCEPSYPEVCVPSFTPDLNCGDISDRRFAVLLPDPHGFDWNKDGIGCEIGQSGDGSVGLPAQGTVKCGQVVQGSVILTANLTCTGDGLIVGDDGTIINLNGFGIYGPGADSSKVGIGISEDNVAITGPGIISGFQAGILATGAKELVTTQ